MTSPAAELALEQLDGSGVVGLGLFVPRSGRDHSPSTCHCSSRRTGRTSGSAPTTRRCRPTRSLRWAASRSTSASGWVDEANAGRLDGAESGLKGPFLGCGGSTPPGVTGALYITANVVLWPKVAVLSLSQAWFDDLERRAARLGAAGGHLGDAGIGRRDRRRGRSRHCVLRAGRPYRFGHRRAARGRPRRRRTGDRRPWRRPEDGTVACGGAGDRRAASRSRRP